MLSQDVIDAITIQVVEVLNDIVKSNNFGCVELVTSILLDRYQLPSFDCLNVGSMNNIPILQWLIHINTKVSDCFFVHILITITPFYTLLFIFII